MGLVLGVADATGNGVAVSVTGEGAGLRVVSKRVDGMGAAMAGMQAARPKAIKAKQICKKDGRRERKARLKSEDKFITNPNHVAWARIIPLGWSRNQAGLVGSAGAGAVAAGLEGLAFARQKDAEGAPPAQFTRDPDAAALRFDERFSDEQPQAGIA